jgi:hypothetical protein
MKRILIICTGWMTKFAPSSRAINVDGIATIDTLIEIVYIAAVVNFLIFIYFFFYMYYMNKENLSEFVHFISNHCYIKSTIKS